MEEVGCRSLLDRFVEAASIRELTDSFPLDQNQKDWLDRDRFRRGQQFVRDNLFGVMLSHYLSGVGVYFWPPLYRMLVYYGKYQSLHTLSRLNSSIILHMMNWYEGDLWDPSSTAYRSMSVVKERHRRVGNYANKNRVKVDGVKLDTTRERVMTERNLLRFIQGDLFSDQPVPVPTDGVYMSQLDLAMVVLVSVGFVVTCPEKVGIHTKDERGLCDFVYMWRVIGRCLGIEDRYNPCEGTLQEVRDLVREFGSRVAVPVIKSAGQQEEYFWRMMVVSSHQSSLAFRALSWDPEAIKLYLTSCLGITRTESYACRRAPWYTRLYVVFIRFCLEVLLSCRPIAVLCNFVASVLLKRLRKSLDLVMCISCAVKP